MAADNGFTKILADNPADFSFGLIGVPMALAIQRVANLISSVNLSLPTNLPIIVGVSLSLLLVLAIQIAVAVLVSTYAFKQAADLWKEERGRKELAGGIFGIAVFAVFLLLISLLPTSAAGGRIQPVQTGVFLCFAALSLVCTPFIRLFKENHLEENMMAMLAILSFLAFLMSFFLVVNIDP